MRVGGQYNAPAAVTPGKEPVPIVQEAGWAPGPVWTGAENLARPPGFDPRSVQPVASRYTDWAIAAADFIALHVRSFFQNIIVGVTHVYKHTWWRKSSKAARVA